MSESVTTIFCPPSLRELWRQEGSPLPGFWRTHYPQLFDDDDLRIAESQRFGHFAEWFAAIHLFHRDGSMSLIEKYDTYENHYHNRMHRNVHRRKVAIYEKVVTEKQRAILHEICSRFRVQLPDLLVLSSDGSFSFVEIKGPGDGSLNRVEQRGSREAIREGLGVPVEVLKVAWSTASTIDPVTAAEY